MPKRCHSCKATDHLIADCPKAPPPKEIINKFSKTPRKKTERQKSRPKSKPDEGGVDEHSSILPSQNGDEVNDKTTEKDN